MATEQIIYQFQASGADKVVSAVKNINAENEALRRFLKELQSAFNLSEKGALSYAKSLGITGSSLLAYQKAIVEVETAQKNLGKQVPKTTGSIEEQRKQIDFLSAQYIEAARSFSTSLLAGTASDAIKVNQEFGKLRALLANTTKDADEAEKAFQFLKKTSDDFGVVLLESGKGFAKLQASVGNLSTTEKLFRGIAAASATYKLTQDEVNGSLLALSQIASKGAIQMEELRGQLGERLPGTLKLVAEALGTTTAELEAFVKANRGDIVRDLDKIGQKLVDTFEKKGLASAKNLVAEQARFQNSLNEVFDKIGSKLTPIVEQVVKFGGTLLDAFKRIPEPIQNLVIAVTGLTVGFGALALSFGALSLAAPALLAAFASGTTILGGFVTAIATTTVSVGGLLTGLGGLALLAGKAIVVLAALGVAVAAVAKGFEVAKNSLNFEDTLATLEETSAKASVITDRLADAGIRQNKILVDANAIKQQGGRLSAEQIAAVEREIRINKIYSADLEQQIKALKDKKDANGNLTSAYAAEIAVLERTLKVTNDKTSQLQALTVVTKTAAKSLDDLSDAYDRNNATLEENNATRQAAILEKVKGEDEANKAILASDIATAKQRLTNQKLYLSQLEALLSTQKTGSKEAEKTEAEIVKIRTSAAKERINIAKLEAEERRGIEEKLLKDLDEANKKALKAIDNNTKLQVEAVKRQSLGSLEAKKNENALLAKLEEDASRQRLALVEQEQQKLLQIRTQISGEEFTKRQLDLEQQKSDAILAIAQKETASLQAEGERRLAILQEQFDRRIEAQNQSTKGLELDRANLQNQTDLLEGQLAILTAQSELKQKDLESDIAKLDRLIEQSDQYTNQSSLIAQRDAKQKALFAEEKAFLAQKQELERQIFELKANQTKLERDIAISTAQTNKIEAERLLQTLAATRASQEQLAAAQRGIQLAERGLAIAIQARQNADQQIEQQRVIITQKQEQEKKDLAISQAQRKQEAATKGVAKNISDAANATNRLADAAKEVEQTIINFEDALKDARVGAAILRDEFGKIIGLFNPKTVDPNELLKEQLNLELKLAETQEAKAALQAQIDALELSQAKEKLGNLKEEIKLNNELLNYRKQTADLNKITGFYGVGLGVSNDAFFKTIKDNPSLLAELLRSRRRFKGGEVRANKPYVVGEDPRTGAILPSSEVFVPKVSGYVMAARQVREALSGMALPAAMPIANTSKANSSDRLLGKIENGIGTLNRQVGKLQPQIKEVNINAPSDQSGKIVEQMMVAQLKAAKRFKW